MNDAAQDTNLSFDPDEVLTPQNLRTMQIIAGALLMGVFSFLAVALFLGTQRNGQDVLSLVAGAMLAVLGPLSLILPGILTQSALRKIAAGTWPIPPGTDAALYASTGAKVMVVWQTTLIVGLALLEGTAFLNILAYLVEGHLLSLGVLAVAVLLMLFKFPTAGRVRAWLDRQAVALTELRQ